MIELAENPCLHPTPLPAETDLEAWTPDQIPVKAAWPHPQNRQAITITASPKDAASGLRTGRCRALAVPVQI